ncbi:MULTISPECIES: HAD hydrolase-like protein [Streptomycetaceae]|uniref:Hydrolase n=1 Tax=Streptantibioticus cattleyicolor (strain ATCC 35852 / DSM 46488 / JCM 4925 / NBRC 14057 / NRRL 8057) TaxID=1003195 RepID=F8JXX3_STREN|nr:MULTISPECIES: HAD hydrolase-like protein [Streptomycetaceae]AEW93353.1 hydrolase [Streptantibioticus cattleyicolor NRRL 8057 = DSM 46488]MYS58068.1 HAD hydrolase-like protein [Streptomyces sp. SID5468]CCB73710.1 putative hydrolase [Streptantibioticus cattleyicolor NRRL 8057 = DSM 46488]
MNARTRPGGSEEPLHEAYDTALLDLDGVVYAGGRAIEHAVSSLGAAREGGMRLAYVTNNALRTPDAVAAHLTELGVPADASDVVTSAQAVARLIAEQVAPGSLVLAIGGEGLRVALREQGLEPVDSADDDPVAVVQGYGGPKMPWERLAEAGYAVARGVPWYASNTDLTIPGPRGIAPGNGAAVEVVRIAAGGGDPQVAGKPQPPMHRETILRTGARRPLVVGDRLDTDIEGAHVGEVDSLLVLTGVTTPAHLLAAEPRHRPTYLAADLRGLLTGHPPVTPHGDGFRCGGWSAGADGGALRVEGDGDPCDGLRALCAAAWTAAGDGPGRLDGEKALARLGW